MRRRSVLVASAGVVAAAGAVVFGVGEAATRPQLHPAGPLPAGLPVEAVALKTADGAPVGGWLVRGLEGQGAVLLLHGVRSDRSQMVARARFLHRLGFTALLIDLPGHGESPAEHITFGANESQGVTAALAWLATRFPGDRVGVIGVSMGAAALVLARPDPPPAAMVLESMYATIREAVSDRLAERVGPAGRMLAPVLLGQMPLRLGISADDLRPIAALAELRAPLLLASGSLDTRTTPAETRRLFAAAAAEPKELWIVDGAKHVDLHAFDRAPYEARVGEFLARTLRAPALA
jgi:alpha-beta hydrolase superfamily lysophospholipase